MFSILQKLKLNIDWILFSATIPLLGAGLVTMDSFDTSNPFFWKQLMWIAVAWAVFFGISLIDVRFLRRTDVLVWLFLGALGLLLALLILGHVTMGAKSWLSFGGFSVQPSDPLKIILILILAKYFSRRHVEIAHIKHIIVSGIYAFVAFALVFLQPDFGTAVILFCVWLGMTLVSGISKKHLAALFMLGVVTLGFLWGFVFHDYQKQRILTFLHPYTNITGTGYNAFQSRIAVGSGELTGKGVGYGTQSRLKFLPEYQTDFIFAAFAEEWGFVGVILLFVLFGIVIWRILDTALLGATNFEMLYGMGLAILFVAHILVHIGTNVGLMPVTGTTIPFLSYGGSHLVTEYLGLGILMSMRRYSRAAHRDDLRNEFVGL